MAKRFFSEGMTAETGSAIGAFFYTRDHLESVWEMTDNRGRITVRYDYDPFGRQTMTGGSVGSDFGFAGMFWSSEIGLNLTLFRAYDPGVGRWLSRDRLKHAEFDVDPNLYAYVHNDPVNAVDRLGLFPSPFRVPKCYCLCQHTCGVPPTPFGITTRDKCAKLCGPYAEMRCIPIPFA